MDLYTVVERVCTILVKEQKKLRITTSYIQWIELCKVLIRRSFSYVALY